MKYKTVVNDVNFLHLIVSSVPLWYLGMRVLLGMVPFQGYPVCLACRPQVMIHFSTSANDQRQQEWTNALALQLQFWRRQAIEARGMSASLGVAIGGAVATIAGITLAAAQGVMQGASSSSDGPAAIMDESVPPPPQTETQMIRRPSLLRRSFSSGDMSQWVKEEPCPVCQLGQKSGHIFRGGCTVLPWSVYSTSGRQIAREEETTSTLPVSAVEDSGAINPDEEVIRDITLVQPTGYTAVTIVVDLS